MKGPFEADNDATPLTAEEQEGLIPTHIALRSELNEFEQANIAEADAWAFSRKRNVLDETFLKSLHRRMLNRVWRWAGDYRKTARNLGIDAYKIQPELVQILADVRHWIEHKTHSPDEIAVRFHHRIVQVHPFPNGNGRWSRLAADLLIFHLGGERFTWGSTMDLQAPGEARKAYIDALHAADNYDLEPLIAFARS